MEIGLSTLVWIALLLVVIKFWRNIVNLIGGLIWLGVFVLVALFIVTNFTTLNVDKYVDLTFYDELRRGNEEYLVEKKDTAFDSAIKAKDGINSIGTEEDVFTNVGEGGEVSTEGVNVAKAVKIEESNLNFNDESKEGIGLESSESTSNTDDTEDTDKESKSEGSKDKETDKVTESGLISYDKVEEYLEGLGSSMNQDTKNLVRNLSPYVSWEYSDGEWYIESRKEGILIEER